MFKLRRNLQAPDTVVMVRPAAFSYNEQTAVSNAFQQETNASDQKVQQYALNEFDALADLLQSRDINVVIFNDLIETYTPDAVFPNNWLACMPDGKAFLFPMEADNRRRERRVDIPETLRDKHGFNIPEIINYAEPEVRGMFLEGTGSMVFDHINRIAYANQSTRTHPDLFQQFCEENGYTPVLFQAVDADGNMIYHTNVMMAIGERFAVVCTESILPNHREEVIHSLEHTGHEIVDITFDQVNHFAGNMIELAGKDDQRYIVMSSQAFGSLREEQVQALSHYGEILHSPIPTIEKLGGGSVRCMLAGIHAQRS